MPVLKWRMGEYQALFRLRSEIKNSIYPLFIIPPIEYDFEMQRQKKTAHEHISPFCSKLSIKWGDKKAILDIHESLHLESMDNGDSVYEFVFNEIKNKNLNIKPLICLRYSDDFISGALSYSKDVGCGFAFRIDFDDLVDIDSLDEINKIINNSGVHKSNIDIIIDFNKDTNYQPINDVCDVFYELISELDSFNEYSSIYIVGTALDFSAVTPRTQVIQHRDDWDFYKKFYASKSTIIKNIGFGDYGIETPDFAPSIDMRKIKPAARLIYSIEKGWLIIKGGAFRDNPSQMHELCDGLVNNSGVFMGEAFSNGDKKIYNCANKSCNPGNMTTWKEASTSHHISFVVTQLASFHE